MVILGIDPGTATTGYGLIRFVKRKKQIKFLDCGCIITSPKLLPQERLRIIEKKLNKIIREYNPSVLVIEKLFFFKNSKTIISIAQTKGVIFLVAAKRKIPIYEFTPLEMKVTITGYGRAQKVQVQRMIKRILGLEELPKPDDAADALGLAICYTNLWSQKS
jgi:crossover junction endodeoxyribonuclease RuvC